MARVDPAQYRETERYRFSISPSPAAIAAATAQERQYLAKTMTGLGDVSLDQPLRWPPGPGAGQLGTELAVSMWDDLRARPLERVQTIQWVMQDWLLGLRPVALPARRGSNAIQVRWHVWRTEAYYRRGGGDVDLDRLPGLYALRTILQPRPIPARHLCAAGVKVRRGATQGHYLITTDQYLDLYFVERLLRTHGVRIPEGVQAPYLSGERSPFARSEQVVDLGTDQMIRCPRPDHEDVHPSAKVYLTGGIYCFACAAWTGEWRHLDQPDWTWRPQAGRARWAPGLEGVLPDRIRVRAYGTGLEQDSDDGDVADVDGSPGVLAADPPLLSLDHSVKCLDTPLSDTPLQQTHKAHRGGRRAGAGRPRKAQQLDHTRLADQADPVPDVAAVVDDHPIDRLLRQQGAHADRAAWQRAKDAHPVRVTWTTRLRQPPALDVWGAAIRPYGHVHVVEFATRSSRGGRAIRRYDQQLDLIEAQVWADRRAWRDAAEEEVRGVHRDLLQALPLTRRSETIHPHDLVDPAFLARVPEDFHGSLRALRQKYLSVGLWSRSGLRSSTNGIQRVEASRFDHEVCTRYVLIDIDGLTIPRVPADPEQAAVYAEVSDGYLARGPRKLRARRYYAHLEVGDQAIARAAQQVQDLVSRHPDYTGRIYVLRTGPSGVQVAAELRQTRWDTRALWACQDFRAQVQRLADLALAALHAEGCQDGRIDPSLFGPGKWCRRAGWRLAKDGTLFRSRLIYASSRRPWEVEVMPAATVPPIRAAA